MENEQYTVFDMKKNHQGTYEYSGNAHSYSTTSEKRSNTEDGKNAGNSDQRSYFDAQKEFTSYNINETHSGSDVDPNVTHDEINRHAYQHIHGVRSDFEAMRKKMMDDMMKMQTRYYQQNQ